VLRRLVLLSTLVFGAAGCGGSSSSSPPSTGARPPATTAPVVSTASTSTASAKAKARARGKAKAKAKAKAAGSPQMPYRASLVTDGRNPVVGKPWSFTVRAFNRDGTPVAGTVKAEVLLSGKLIDTIGWFGFKGTLKHAVRWRSDKKGQPIVFRAQIVANGGVRNLDYPILVK